ncbi:SDR family oxidoreductase [Chondromyces apiculatus]|uniref:NADPH-dependent methylglyoxal reductase (D-lactaldehyde dehydrogenase) n=1 Tax=Chondromyces apiculatus DSM 436 TaxID=1192034 RepID=A0A017SXG2_9BACT|nr:aldehyde reductase [Chondromyces apiculatus]EYF01310.1 NADPH-dependent methylglyoxal reductase (D-lactaldehyde dehydrogenase) [Chondromyces apiculatus DSM 436]
MHDSATVLVTGGSGFVGSHVIAQLLAAGHRVRTTVRSLRREPEVRAMLKEAGPDPGDRLSFFAADLERDAGWAEAVAGCDYVQHVASPLPIGAPRHEDEVIVPARDGALRVLRAARDASVRRVVLTSSFAAIGYGHAPQVAPFDETTWTDPGRDVAAYVKSKAVAERAAWDFVAAEGRGLELSVINPTAIFGPVLGPDYASSVVVLRSLLEGALPACPRLYFGIVDVRDVADLHLRAMTDPAAKGERFVAVAGDFLPIVEMARILKRRLGPVAHRVPTREVPDFVVRVVALFAPAMRQMVPELGKVKNATSAKARRTLGWTPRSSEEALVAAAESLQRFGLLKGAKPRA